MCTLSGRLIFKHSKHALLLFSETTKIITQPKRLIPIFNKLHFLPKQDNFKEVLNGNLVLTL